MAEVYIDDQLVAKGINFNNQPEEFKIRLSKGPHQLTIHYFYKQIQNQLSILYKTNEMSYFAPFEDLIHPVKK